MRTALRAIVQRIASIARKQSGVEAVYLFGSAVRNRMHLESDLDLAVLFSDQMPRSRRESVRLKLAEAMEEGTGLGCDLIDFQEASTWLRFHILRGGRLLYERSKRENQRFVAHSLLDYFDFQPVYERMERRLLEHLKAA